MVIQILAFNTVTELCSVALMINKKVYDCSIVAPRGHAERILIMINQLLVDAGISLKSLDCIVFDEGPGSFVGVRIGISIAQGLALGADLPLVAVSSLSTLAQKARRIFLSDCVIATIDARMNQLYWAQYLFDLNNNSWVCICYPCLVNELVAQNLISRLQEEWMIVGTGWDNYSKLKCCINQNNLIILKKMIFPEAQDMISLGVSAFENKKILNPNEIKPIYLRVAVI